MSHVDPGPLATYESLADPHLTGYFNNTRMRKHLKRMGLITRRGEIVSEKVFKLNNARKEHQRHIRDVLAQAIVHKALDMERHRQMHIKKQLEEIAKIERVRRVRAERSLRGDEDILPLLTPREKQQKQSKKDKASILQTVTDSDDYEQRPPQSVGYPAIPEGPPYNTRSDRMKMQYPDVEVDNQHLYGLDKDALRTFTLNLSRNDLGSGVSPYRMAGSEGSLPKKKRKKRPATASGVISKPRVRPASNARSLRLHRKEPPMMHRSQIHTLARVTFKYLGQMVHLDHEEEDPRDEIVVMQQHCGGENIRIFKGMLMKGDKFVIISRRHRTFPFSLTFYLNGVQVERLSTCCEYKHKTGYKLGAKSSHFGIVKLEGSQPCFKCLIAQGKLKTKPDPTPPPSGGRTKPSRQKTKKKVKSPKNEKPKKYDEEDSSKSSTTTEDVHPDGPRDPSEISSSEVSSDSSPLTTDAEDTDDDSDTETESKLPSISNVSDSSDTESSDSQKKVQRVKSPKNRITSGKRRVKSPNERPKTPGKEKPSFPKTPTPPPVKTEVRSPPPPILKVEESSSNDSSVREDSRGSLSSLGSHSVTSISEAGDIAEKITTKPKTPKSDSSDDENLKLLLEDAKILANNNKQPDTTGKNRSSDSDSSSSDSSEAHSVKSRSSEDAKEMSILPIIKGKWKVDLKNRKLTSNQINELKEYVKQDPASAQIQEFSLANCALGDDNSKVLLTALLKSSSLKSMDFSGNRLSVNCVEDLLEVCYKNPVEHLNLSDNPLRDIGSKELLVGFAKSQEHVVAAKVRKRVSQNLIASVLKDSRDELSDDVGRPISSSSSMSSLASSAVSESVLLKSLDLSHTTAGHEAFTALGHWLGMNPNLHYLNLSGNSISTTALEIIIKPLSDDSNKNLKSLILNDTTLDDRHAEVIAKNLIMRSRLTELSVKGNRITEIGKEKLNEYRKVNKSMEKLAMD